MPDLEPVTHVLTTPEGERLHCPSWLPEGEMRAGVVLVHGVGEHSGRYEGVKKVLLERGIALHGGDLRGHGRSTGRRAHIWRWDEYREDLRQRLEHLQKTEAGGKPLFLMGHSLGALVVLEAAVTMALPVAGLIVSGAPIQPAGLAKPPLILLARVLSVVWPTLRLRLPLRVSDLVSDEVARTAWAEDPLLFSGVTARWGVEAMAAVERVMANSAAIQLPLLVVHGGLDPVNDVAGAEALFQAVGSVDKELRIYARSRHEPHQDIERASVMQDLAEWVEARVRGAEAAV